MTVFDIYNFLNERFPFNTAAEWDNSGLVIGDKNNIVTKAVISLDCTEDTVKLAEDIGAELIITHHPLIFPETESLLANALIPRLESQNISLISAHTNLDKAVGGVNDCLAQVLGLKNVKTVPTLEGFSIKLGELENELTPEQFARYVGERLKVTPRFSKGSRNIRHVAVCGGSGGDFLPDAIVAAADAFVTADIKHHVFLDAGISGVTLIDGGHYATEDTVIEPLKNILQAKFTEILFVSNHFIAFR